MCGIYITGLCRQPFTEQLQLSINFVELYFLDVLHHPVKVTSCMCLLSILVLQSPAEIHASTGTALMDTATSPLAVNVSAMMDGRALDAATEKDVGGVLCAFKSVQYHKCSYFPCVL